MPAIGGLQLTLTNLHMQREVVGKKVGFRDNGDWLRMIGGHCEEMCSLAVIVLRDCT